MSEFEGIVFWSRSVCFHTCKVFESIGKRIPVTIAYCQREFRDIQMINVKNVDLVHVQDESSVNNLIAKTRHHLHINNAIKIEPEYKILQCALEMLIHENCYVISLFQEQFPHWGISGFLRRIKWWYIYHCGIGRHIKFIGATGYSGVISMKKIGIPENRLFEFIYTPHHTFSDCDELRNIDTNTNGVVNFLMVGQLVPRKSVEEVVDIFLGLKQNVHLTIVGSGELGEKLLAKASLSTNVSLLGSLDLIHVQKEYAKADYLLLASKFDGWGCSVNEALLQGCKVIVSDRCGSHSLVQNRPFLGKVFRAGNYDELKDIIKELAIEGKLSEEERNRIKEWSICIRPETEAQYFLQILQYIKDRKNKPISPWNH